MQTAKLGWSVMHSRPGSWPLVCSRFARDTGSTGALKSRALGAFFPLMTNSSRQQRHQRRKAEKRQYRRQQNDPGNAPVVGTKALGQHGHIAGARQCGQQHHHSQGEAIQRQAQADGAQPRVKRGQSPILQMIADAMSRWSDQYAPAQPKHG